MVGQLAPASAGAFLCADAQRPRVTLALGTTRNVVMSMPAGRVNPSSQRRLPELLLLAVSACKPSATTAFSYRSRTSPMWSRGLRRGDLDADQKRGAGIC